MRRIIAVGGFACLAGCAQPGSTADAPCFVQRGSYRVDEQNVMTRMEMINTGRACGVTYTREGTPSDGGNIVAQPAHGRARIRQTSNGTAASYMPNRGFAGEDSFRASMGIGGQVMTVNVTVLPPAAPRPAP